jgi:hypothetical protein
MILRCTIAPLAMNVPRVAAGVMKDGRVVVNRPES